jgi:hypothetical protein
MLHNYIKMLQSLQIYVVRQDDLLQKSKKHTSKICNLFAGKERKHSKNV